MNILYDSTPNDWYLAKWYNPVPATGTHPSLIASQPGTRGGGGHTKNSIGPKWRRTLYSWPNSLHFFVLFFYFLSPFIVWRISLVFSLNLIAGPPGLLPGPLRKFRTRSSPVFFASCNGRWRKWDLGLFFNRTSHFRTSFLFLSLSLSFGAAFIVCLQPVHPLRKQLTFWKFPSSPFVTIPKMCF